MDLACVFRFRRIGSQSTGCCEGVAFPQNHLALIVNDLDEVIGADACRIVERPSQRTARTLFRKGREYTAVIGDGESPLEPRQA